MEAACLSNCSSNVTDISVTFITFRLLSFEDIHVPFSFFFFDYHRKKRARKKQERKRWNEIKGGKRERLIGNANFSHYYFSLVNAGPASRKISIFRSS